MRRTEQAAAAAGLLHQAAAADVLAGQAAAAAGLLHQAAAADVLAGQAAAAAERKRAPPRNPGGFWAVRQ